jgi:hypothetical protein
MIPEIREQYNREFTAEKYKAFLEDVHKVHPGAIRFRIAETPVFIPSSFLHRLKEASEEIMQVLTAPDFKKETSQAIPKKLKVTHENIHAEFIILDFAICKNEEGNYIPQLIELQGFPSMNAFQVLLEENYRKHFFVPDGFSNYLNGYNRETYWKLLHDIIVADHDPAEVILLEVNPHEQKTKIDFYLTQDKLGVRPVCITELIKEGKKLYYTYEGKKVPVKRMYNRLIFDDLRSQRKKLGRIVDLKHHLDVEWVSHPNWFYRISKFDLPLLQSKYVPAAYFADKLEVTPADLENYVLKPLYSFAGQGVVLHVKKKDIEKLKDPQNWILQKKIQYAPVIQTPDVPAKCEIRLMFYWKNGDAKPLLVQNLCRLSKGEMVGVRYNADKEWVGAGICFFEQGI